MPSKREPHDMKMVNLTLEESTAIANRLVERLRADTENADKSLENLKGQLAAAQKSREDFTTLADDVISKNRGRLDAAYNEVGLLKEAATSSLLGKVYSHKSNGEWCIAGIYLFFFLASLVTLGIVAGKFLADINSDVTISYSFFAKRILSMLPIYAPLVWFACFSCQRVGMSRRLAEAYSHKSLIGATYVGLAQQIKTISESDLDAYHRLRCELLSAIIRVYERSPIEDLRGLKSYTPIGEVSDAVAKIVGSLPTNMK